MLASSFARRTEIEALIAARDTLSADRRLDAVHTCLVIKRGAADLKQVRSLRPPSHFGATKWFQRFSLLLAAGAFKNLADDAEIFDLIVNFDVITDIGGAKRTQRHYDGSARAKIEIQQETLKMLRDIAF
eukprot:g3376.t1